MRNQATLKEFYNQLFEIHSRSFPDQRPGQYLMNVFGWMFTTKKRDPFFPECDELLEHFKEYANEASTLYQGWELLKKGEE